MITVRARSSALAICLLVLMAGCSREQQDWRAAESSDTTEAYGRFIDNHPESELTRQARTRIAQLGEEHDWQRAGSADTPDAYRDFIAQHPNGKWAQEARIRMQSFSLGERAGTSAIGVASSANSDAEGSAVGGAPGASSTAAASGIGGAPGASPTAAASGIGGVSGASSTAAASGMGGTPGASSTAAASGMGGAPGASSTAASATEGAAGAPAMGVAPTRVRQDGGDFGVQLGAFSSEAAADGQWRVLAGQFRSELEGLQPHIVTADTPSGRVYRLQASVGTESLARGICDSLHKQSQACVAVLPH